MLNLHPFQVELHINFKDCARVNSLGSNLQQINILIFKSLWVSFIWFCTKEAALFSQNKIYQEDFEVQKMWMNAFDFLNIWEFNRTQSALWWHWIEGLFFIHMHYKNTHRVYSFIALWVLCSTSPTQKRFSVFCTREVVCCFIFVVVTKLLCKPQSRKLSLKRRRVIKILQRLIICSARIAPYIWQ